MGRWGCGAYAHIYTIRIPLSGSPQNNQTHFPEKDANGTLMEGDSSFIENEF